MLHKAWLWHWSIMVNVPCCVRRRLDWIIIFVWLQLMRFHRQKMKTFISFPFLFIIAQNDHSVLEIKASIFGKVSRSPLRILAVATELRRAPLRLVPPIFEFMTCVTSLLSGQRTWTTWSVIQYGCHLYQHWVHYTYFAALSVFSVITKFFWYYFLPVRMLFLCFHAQNIRQGAVICRRGVKALMWGVRFAFPTNGAVNYTSELGFLKVTTFCVTSVPLNQNFRRKVWGT